MHKVLICAIVLAVIPVVGCSAPSGNRVKLTKIPGENRVEVMIGDREFTSYWWHPTIFKP
ncbi:MAG: hypothetical protein GY809_29915, partial [Planctomycetes bacterium]|nr:hypothetical protein [Planctomycetota bacterium]